ncbi:hypothetical protein [Lactobacillus sp. ESL0247]|uniref:hypothetical protein n=1 Tax=Lactobacillus sp. ESL0247 TaxID=2069360 RepID=UPI000EFCAE11|nr:hypothetical protein [Lactobacillus sp. ESL0247]RMC24412.1 hypothetical protein F5ESL0247_04365 [Lactobacillus sp. ESL0247]
MLINGKQISNLILGGETFTSKRAFPQYYKFGANKDLLNIPVYEISVSAKSEPSFSPITHSDEHGPHQLLAEIDCSNLVLVYQQVSCNGEQYVFLKTSAIMLLHWEFGIAYWVKASDLGGMLPNPEVGGGK